MISKNKKTKPDLSLTSKLDALDIEFQTGKGNPSVKERNLAGLQRMSSRNQCKPYPAIYIASSVM
jgi:hypothetical protein